MRKIQELPRNIEAEEAIIGCVLLDSDSLDRVTEILKPEYFTIEKHRKFYQAFLELRDHGSAIDLMTVTSWLADQGELEQTGGQGSIAHFVKEPVSSVNVDQYALLVKEKAKARELVYLGDQLSQVGLDATLTWDEKTQKAEEKYYSVMSQRQNPQEGLIGFEDCVAELYNGLQSEVVERIPTGLYDLDGMMNGGMELGSLIVIAGRPSMGKSAIVSSILLEMAQRGLSSVFFSAEMNRKLVTARMIASLTGIELSKILTKQLSHAEVEYISTNLDDFMSLPISIDHPPRSRLTPSYIRTELRRREKVTGLPTGVIALDYLQYLGYSENRNWELSQMTKEFKSIAVEFNCPFICLSQLNRGVESRTNKRPVMSDLRDSGGIEEDADVILMLYRDEYYNPDSPDRGVCEVSVTKNRNGQTGVVKLLFDPKYSRFRNLLQAVS